MQPARATVPPPTQVWRQWMKYFGRHTRRVREFLGLSQAELARGSGVSQGAVSRFESGRGMNTPFLVVLRINLALAQGLRESEPSLLTDDVRLFLQVMSFFDASRGVPPSPGGVPIQALRITPDEEVEQVVRLFRRLPEAGRRAMLAAMEAFAAAT